MENKEDKNQPVLKAHAWLVYFWCCHETGDLKEVVQAQTGDFKWIPVFVLPKKNGANRELKFSTLTSCIRYIHYYDSGSEDFFFF